MPVAFPLFFLALNSIKNCSFRHIVVKKDSTKENIYLDIHLKFGGLWEVAFQREKSSSLGIRLKNITPRPLIRRT